MGIVAPSVKTVSFNRQTATVIGEHINIQNLMEASNKKNLHTIVRAFSEKAQVEFHSCDIGDERNVAYLAAAFQRRTWANPGWVRGWGEGQYPWFYRDPPKR